MILFLTFSDLRVFSSVFLQLVDDADLVDVVYLGYVKKIFFISTRSRGRTLLVTPSKTYEFDVVGFSNLLSDCWRVFLISRVSCLSPIYSYRWWTGLLVIDQKMSFWYLVHCDSFLHFTRTTTSFWHLASACWSLMPSYCDTWYEFGLQDEMDLGLEYNKNRFIYL